MKYEQRFEGKINTGLRARIRESVAGLTSGEERSRAVLALAGLIAFTEAGAATLRRVAADYAERDGASCIAAHADDACKDINCPLHGIYDSAPLGMTTDVALAALDVVRATLAAEPQETVTQAALRCIEQFLATPTYARRELVTQTMVALTLGVSGADDSPSWARVFAAAQLARRLPRPIEQQLAEVDESLAMLDGVIASAKRAGF